MFETREDPRKVEAALLVGVYFDKKEEADAASLLDELRELVNTLEIGIADTLLVRVARGAHPKLLTGTGKADEIVEHARELGCDCIIFDNELSPAQQRNWERLSEVCVIDRNEVILDIFGMRARTREARLQVQLAQLQYSLPRLTRMWTHLDRQGGGGGGVVGARGEGETQLERDRRQIRKQIGRVKGQLDEVIQNRGTQRKERTRVPLPQASIVGYTNAGKSTLLNQLTDSDVLVEDKLFATLDTTTRRLSLPDGQGLLLTDTVGFIRRIPHRLIDAFKATLEETVLADFLVHVLDASQPRVVEFHQTTMKVLAELGADDKRVLTVLNKTDLADDPGVLHGLDVHFPDAVHVSALTGEGMDVLRHRFNEMLHDRVLRMELALPPARADLIAVLHREGKVVATAYEPDAVHVTAIIPRQLESRFTEFLAPAAAPDVARADS